MRAQPFCESIEFLNSSNGWQSTRHPNDVMPRWIAFDPDSAAELARQFGVGNVELRQNGLFAAAFTAESPTVMLLPAEQPGRVMLVRVTPKGKQNAQPAARTGCPEAAAEDAPEFVPSGLLGLSDELVFHHQPEVDSAEKPRAGAGVRLKKLWNKRRIW